MLLNVVIVKGCKISGVTTRDGYVYGSAQWKFIKCDDYENHTLSIESQDFSTRS